MGSRRPYSAPVSSQPRSYGDVSRGAFRLDCRDGRGGHPVGERGICRNWKYLLEKDPPRPLTPPPPPPPCPFPPPQRPAVSDEVVSGGVLPDDIANLWISPQALVSPLCPKQLGRAGTGGPGGGRLSHLSWSPPRPASPPLPSPPPLLKCRRCRSDPPVGGAPSLRSSPTADGVPLPSMPADRP